MTSQLRHGLMHLAALSLMVPLLALAPSAAVAADSASASPPDTTVSVSGTLVAASSESLAGPAYALVLDDGNVQPISAAFAQAPATPARMRARLVVPRAVVSTLVSRGHRPEGHLSADDPVASEALRLVDHRGLRMQVASYDLAPAVVPVTGSVTHTWHVAVPTNLGSVSDAAAMAAVAQAAGYWEDEANGRISDVIIDQSVHHYSSSVASGGDCGLISSDEFFAMQEEATALLKTLPESDQVLVVLPKSYCDRGGAVGRATGGESFGSGGFLIAEDGSLLTGTLAHEVGHNYGLNHADLGPCTTSGCAREYGGIYDVMGFALDGVNQLTALSTPYRAMSGITDAGEVAEADFDAPFSKSWTLQPRSDESGQRSVHLVDPDTNEDLWVDYRSGTGQDAGAAYAGGYSLEGWQFRPGVVVEQRWNESHIAVVPGSSPVPGESAVAYVAGGSWLNGSGSLKVAVTAMSPTSATVNVTYAPTTAWTSVGGVSLTGEPRAGGGYLDLELTGDWEPSAYPAVEWLRDGEPVGQDSGWQYSPFIEDVGHQISARVTLYGFGLPILRPVAGPVTIAPAQFTVTENPTLSGTPEVGEQLSAIGGTWDTVYAPADPETPGVGQSVWQWQADGVPITGAADNRFFTVTSAQAGKKIRACQVLSSVGYEPRTICSNEVGPVPVPVAEPEPISPAPTPRVTGTPKVGVRLYAAPGTWAPGTSLRYQWLVGGLPVSGATGTTFVPSGGHVGKVVSVRVTGVLDGFLTTPRTSPVTAAVARGTLLAPVPRIAGYVKVGRTLAARPGTWTSGTALHYRWYANGVAIRYATRATLLLRSTMRGKHIIVRVTGTKYGYTTAVRTSARTVAVRR